MKDWGIFSTESLRRILRIPLWLKCSSWCGGSTASNGGSWRPPVVLGGEKWGFSVWVAFWRRREWKNHVFHVENVFITCKSRLAHLWALIAIPFSIGIGLSAPLGAQRHSLSIGIALSAPFALSERSKVVIFKIPTVRLWNTCLRKLRTNLKMIQRLTNPGSWFYGTRFRQKSKIS